MELDLRALNRATLARQLLLERARVEEAEAVATLVGLQAQQPMSPFVALWSRLGSFSRAALAARVEDRTIVKATLLRATLHLCAAEDYWPLRATLQPALEAALEGVLRRREVTFAREEALAVAREAIAEQPRTFAELSALLAAWRPDADVGAMRYTVRTQLPMVQVPASTAWSYPATPRFALAEDWVPAPQELPPPDPAALLRRYLAAYGPATLTDLQTFSGLGSLAATLGPLRDELRILRDARGRELLDLPDAPLPDPDTPAPPRLLPAFDSLLLAHRDRTRVIADEHRPRVYLPGLRVAATFLVDGFVAGVWTLEKGGGRATVVLEPLTRLRRGDRDVLAAEARALAAFLEPRARRHDVRFED